MSFAAGLYRSRQMERSQTCPICLDKFRIPKVLPCSHTFCLAPCLTNLLEPRARSIRCPECHREHPIPPGGIQAFPAYTPMVAVPDHQPPPPTTTMSTTMSTTTMNLPDCCFICKQRKLTLIECQDCSQYLCTDCREPHLRDTFNKLRSSVSQLHRSLPKLNERMAAYDQRVYNVRANAEQIQREITLNIATLIDELKKRENMLLTEAEARMQSQLRTFRIQQEPIEVEIAGVVNFCQSIETFNPNAQLVSDTDLANMRAQYNHYTQQIDALQARMPTDTQQLRLAFENQRAISSSIQNLGRLIDPTQERQQPQFSSATPQTANRYRRASQNSRNNSRQSQDDRYQNRENSYDTRGSMTQYASLPDLTQTLPARLNAQTVHRGASNHQYVSSMTAARSLEGDDRPIFGGPGGGGRGRSRFPSIAPIPEHEPLSKSRQRRGTFVLDEPSLPNLPRSSAQRPRDKVNVRELYNVRRRKRAQTPVAFTVNLNDPPPSRNSEIIDGGTV